MVEDVSNYHFLSTLFGISVSVVGSEITNMLSAVCEKSNRYLAWPTEEDWRSMHVTLTKLPMAVGAIDGTSHRIYRPEVEPQVCYYYGQHHFQGERIMTLFYPNRIRNLVAMATYSALDL